MHRRNRVFRRIGDGGRESSLERKEGEGNGGEGERFVTPRIFVAEHKQRIDSASAAKMLCFSGFP